jgi:hypothetical protein
VVRLAKVASSGGDNVVFGHPLDATSGLLQIIKSDLKWIHLTHPGPAMPEYYGLACWHLHPLPHFLSFIQPDGHQIWSGPPQH